MHEFQYKIINAPSKALMLAGKSAGMNVAIVHSMGHHRHREGNWGFAQDDHCIFFEDHPLVASALRADSHRVEWTASQQAEVTDLLRFARAHGLKGAFHFYEPSFPPVFVEHYPQILGQYTSSYLDRPEVRYSEFCTANDEALALVRSKYAQFARMFPELDAVVLTLHEAQGRGLEEHQCPACKEIGVGERLVRYVHEAMAGLHSVRADITVGLRLWGRNFPSKTYQNFFETAVRWTGVPRELAQEMYTPRLRPHNDPERVLPYVEEHLNEHCLIIYKSTVSDIGIGQPLTRWMGRFPRHPEVIEISIENMNRVPYPTVIGRQIQAAVTAGREKKLAGVMSCPINVSNNDRDFDPHQGGFGRMNWHIFVRALMRPELPLQNVIEEFLRQHYRGSIPPAAVNWFVELEPVLATGAGWNDVKLGGGSPLKPLRVTQAYLANYMWCFEDAEQRLSREPEAIARFMEQKDRAVRWCEQVLYELKHMKQTLSPELYGDLQGQFRSLACWITMCADFHIYLLIQWALQDGTIKPTRAVLQAQENAMARFVRAIAEYADTPLVADLKRRFASPGHAGLARSTDFLMNA